jgi:CTP synthase
MPELSKTHLGGTMRLGQRRSYFKKIVEKSIVKQLYGDREFIDERHRHRFEVNPDLVAKLEAGSSLVFVAQDETGKQRKRKREGERERERKKEN